MMNCCIFPKDDPLFLEFDYKQKEEEIERRAIKFASISMTVGFVALSILLTALLVSQGAPLLFAAALVAGGLGTPLAGMGICLIILRSCC